MLLKSRNNHGICINFCLGTSNFISFQPLLQLHPPLFRRGEHGFFVVKTLVKMALMKQDWPPLPQSGLERWQLHWVMMWNGEREQERHEEHPRDSLNSCHCWRQLLKKCHDTVWREVGSQRHPPSLYFMKQFWQNAPFRAGSSHAAFQLISSILDWRNLFWKPQHHSASMSCLRQDCNQALLVNVSVETTQGCLRDHQLPMSESHPSFPHIFFPSKTLLPLFQGCCVFAMEAEQLV